MGVDLCVRMRFDCPGLNDGGSRAGYLWLRIRGRPTGRYPVLGEETNEIFYKWLGEVSQSLALLLMRYFNLQTGNTMQKREINLRRFLECEEYTFLTQLMREPTREAFPQDLLFVNRERLVRDVVAGGSLGQSDHRMIIFNS